MRRDNAKEDTVRSKGKANYFSREIWTSKISLKRLDKFDFWRGRFRAHFEASRAVTRATSKVICPTGNRLVGTRHSFHSSFRGARKASEPRNLWLSHVVMSWDANASVLPERLRSLSDFCESDGRNGRHNLLQALVVFSGLRVERRALQARLRQLIAQILKPLTLAITVRPILPWSFDNTCHDLIMLDVQFET
jgi:hypothetical protein